MGDSAARASGPGRLRRPLLCPASNADRPRAGRWPEWDQCPGRGRSSRWPGWGWAGQAPPGYLLADQHVRVANGGRGPRLPPSNSARVVEAARGGVQLGQGLHTVWASSPKRLLHLSPGLDGAGRVLSSSQSPRRVAISHQWRRGWLAGEPVGDPPVQQVNQVPPAFSRDQQPRPTRPAPERSHEGIAQQASTPGGQRPVGLTHSAPRSAARAHTRRCSAAPRLNRGQPLQRVQAARSRCRARPYSFLQPSCSLHPQRGRYRLLGHRLLQQRATGLGPVRPAVESNTLSPRPTSDSSQAIVHTGRSWPRHAGHSDQASRGCRRAHSAS